MSKKNEIENTTAEVRANPLFGLTTIMPGGIEASERRGQQQLLRSLVLPTEGLAKMVEMYAPLGMKAGGVVDGDELFTNVTLPDGWSKEGSDHAMWSYVVDDKGRRRAALFYKAAFYDRRARIGTCSRFTVGLDLSDESGYYARKELCHVVEDSKVVRFSTSAVADPAKDAQEADRRALFERRAAIESAQRAECIAWLDANYPNHADPIRSWEDLP